MRRDLSNYSVLFNHDSTNAFCTDTPYQPSDEPVCVEQVQGLVDEVADAGCDTLLLSPTWGQITPLWISDRAPLWQQKGKDLGCPDTFQGNVIRRIRDFLLAGNDFVRITEQRCKEKHYVLAQQNWFYQNQFPLDLAKPGPRRPQAAIHISADFTDPEVRAPFRATAVLRLQFEDDMQDTAVIALRLGRLLKPCQVEGELFPTEYIEGVPTDHSHTLDYELPLELLEKGLNTFTLRLDAGDRAVVTRLEIAVYRKDGHNPDIQSV